MNYLEYPLFAEGYINRFLITGVYTKRQQFEKAVLQGRVNEWHEKGLRSMKIRAETNLYLRGENHCRNTLTCMTVKMGIRSLCLIRGSR